MDCTKLDIESRVHLERLRRHVEISQQHNDLASLFDLAHSLRIWTELYPALEECWPAIFGSMRLRSPRWTKSTMRQLSAGTKAFFAPIRLRGKTGTEVFGVGFANYAFTPEEIRAAYAKGPPQEHFRDQSLSQWMGSGVMRIRSEGWKFDYSRKSFIEIVCNRLGPSHPRISPTRRHDGYRKEEPYVIDLMQMQVMNMPIPFAYVLWMGADLYEGLNTAFGKIDGTPP